MRQLKFATWAVGNIVFASFVVALSWAGAYAAVILLTVAWPAALLFALILPVGTVFWSAWLYGQGAVSIALARLANRTRGTLAHLSYDRYGPTIELDTHDESVRRWHRLGLSAMLPGWQGVGAAYLLTASGGLALAGPSVFGWPLWASALFLIAWAAGWVWYAARVRYRLRHPESSYISSLF